MSLSFGQAIGRAARVRPGQKIVSVLVDEAGIETAKKALLRAKSRMPVDVRVIVGTDVKSIGTRPREIKEITAEQIQAEEAAAKEKAEKKEAKKEGKKEEKKAEAAPATAAAGPAKEEKKETGPGKAAEKK
jgi:peptidoglycan hydrolase CwlO-like protein